MYGFFLDPDVSLVSLVCGWTPAGLHVVVFLQWQMPLLRNRAVCGGVQSAPLSLVLLVLEMEQGGLLNSALS